MKTLISIIILTMIGINSFADPTYSDKEIKSIKLLEQDASDKLEDIIELENSLKNAEYLKMGQNLITLSAMGLTILEAAIITNKYLSNAKISKKHILLTIGSATMIAAGIYTLKLTEKEAEYLKNLIREKREELEIDLESIIELQQHYITNEQD